MISFRCSFADSDGDGLSNAEEQSLGTDPKVSDTDGDGLSDLEESCCQSTDPIKADTDGDGDSDGFEVEYGLDPTSNLSHSYTLGWPIARPNEKEAIDSSILSNVFSNGDRMTRSYLLDIKGEIFDIYDYIDTGTPTIISAITPSVSSYQRAWALDGTWRPYDTPARWVRKEVRDGNVNYANVILSDMFPATDGPSLDSLLEFCTYEMPMFGCFADTSWDFRYRSGAFGEEKELAFRFYLLDENMIIRAVVRQEDGSIYGEALFDDFHAALAQELGIEVPTDP